MALMMELLHVVQPFRAHICGHSGTISGWKYCALDISCGCALQGYGIINLFLLANLITTTSTLPILLGLLEGEVTQRIITPLSVLFGCWFSFASLIVWAYCMAGSWGLSFNDVSGCSPQNLHLLRQSI